jgi:hypothetical protein
VDASFATFEQFAARTKRTFTDEEKPLIEALLEDASTYLRDVIGADLYPRRTVTATLWPSVDGTVTLPRPVHGITSVTRDGRAVDYSRADDVTLCGVGSGPVEATFDYGFTDPPAELTRWTITLAFQALVAVELELGVTGAGLSSLGVDDFRASFADGGEHTGITLSDRNADRLRRSFGGASFVVVNQR